MKEIFAIYINGNFSQYIMKSETRLLSKLWEKGLEIKLICVTVDNESYKLLFGK